MMNREKAIRLLGYEDTMVRYLVNFFQLEWDDNADCFHYVNDKNYYLEPYDYEFIELPNSITYEDDFIDGVLFFGDGTIEFHFKENMDAENWASFDESIILSVINELKTISLAR
jgi:hypothetical protein